MKRRKRRPLLLIMLAYFAGAISMLLFLTPGKVSFRELLDQGKRAQVADFDEAGHKVERFGEWAKSCFKKVPKYVKHKLDDDAHL